MKSDKSNVISSKVDISTRYLYQNSAVQYMAHVISTKVWVLSGTALHTKRCIVRPAGKITWVIGR